MNALYTTASETLCLVGGIAVFQLTVLVFRNPHRPRIIQGEWAAIFISVVLVIVIGLAVAFQVHGLTQIGFDPFVAVATAIAIAVAVGWANWHLFRLGDRLRNADSGLSPFRLRPATVAPGSVTPSA